MGLQICAIDIDDSKLDHAKCLDADFVVNAKTGDPAAANIERQPLSSINRIFDRLDQGDVPSRVVLDFVAG